MFHMKQIPGERGGKQEAMDVQAPEVLMSVRHIFLQLDQGVEDIVRPVQAPVDDWKFALDALLAMAED